MLDQGLALSEFSISSILCNNFPGRKPCGILIFIFCFCFFFFLFCCCYLLTGRSKLVSTHSPCPPFLKPPICPGLSYAGQLGLINETSLNRTLKEVGSLSYHDSLDGIEPSAVKAHCSWVISTSDLANLHFHFEGQKRKKRKTNKQIDN